MKILWFSPSPLAQSGYGVQTALFVPRIADILGHEMAINAIVGLEFGRMDWHGIPVYPRGRGGYDGLAAAAAHFQPDIILSLYDVWPFDPAHFGPRWCPWLPIDSEPVSPAVVRPLRKAFQPIAYSRFGEQQLISARLRPLYVPHGYGGDVFRPGDKAAARKSLDWPADLFVAGIVARNYGHRKHLEAQIEAFADFRKDHKDAVLYLHMEDGTGQTNSLNILEFAEYLGIANAVYLPDGQELLTGIPGERLAAIYQALDVLLSVSHGEGFGVPIIEAQACNCPVIVGDWTAMPELAAEGYLIAKEDAERIWVRQGGYRWAARIPAIVAELENAYEDRALERTAHHKVRHYEADVVTHGPWREALDHIEARLAEASEWTMERQLAEAFA